MISRGNMRRQLRASGGITNARQGYGAGSWVKERVRKLIPNELADVAVKAAPFVAPFFPGAAAAMRGIGRFDQRGSIGDAVRQAGATYAFGKVANKGLSSIRTGAGGTGLPNTPPPSSAFNNATTQIGTKGTQVGMESVSKATEFMKNIPIIGELPPLVQQQLLIGGVTSAGTYVYEKFLKEEPPQDESETMEEYMARRKENDRIIKQVVLVRQILWHRIEQLTTRNEQQTKTCYKQQEQDYQVMLHHKEQMCKNMQWAMIVF